MEEYRHPLAQYAVQLGGVSVWYLHRITRTTRLRLVITAMGLEVRTPRNATVAQIDAMIRAHAQWVVDRLRNRKPSVPEGGVHGDCPGCPWQDGDVLPYLGSMYRIHVVPVEDRHFLSLQSVAVGGEGHSVATLRNLQHLHAVLQAWLMQQMIDLGQSRLCHYAPMLGVQWKECRLGNARTRFGSARRDGVIRLNWRLIHFPMAFVDYVIVHELAHLRCMHHGPQFWQWVESVMADYRDRRAMARQITGIALGAPAVRRPPPAKCPSG